MATAASIAAMGSLSTSGLTILNICGFETSGTIETGGLSGTCSIQGTTKRSGFYALRTNPTVAPTTGSCSLYGIDVVSGISSGMYENNTYTRFYFRTAWLPTGGSEEIFAVQDANLAHKLALRISSGGKLSVFDRTGTAEMAEGSTALAANTWHRIEVRCGVETAGWESKDNGPYAVLLDGTNIIQGIGNISSGQSFRVVFGKHVNRNSGSVDFYYDDIAISSDTWPGPGAIVALNPTGDSATDTGWTASGADTNWECIDDLQGATKPYDNNTTYIWTQTTGDAYCAGLQNCTTSGITGDVNWVKAITAVNSLLRRDIPIKTRIRSSDVTSNTDGCSISGSYIMTAKIAVVDPHTEKAWTHVGIDAVEVGVVASTANTGEWRCTMATLMVDHRDSVSGSILSAAIPVRWQEQEKKGGAPLKGGKLDW